MFDSIAQGDRGPAVEDIQKRLLALGHELGPTGVDGVFGGATKDAVRRFQGDHDLRPSGIVDEATWAALVDATFQLGDRLLYLRYPYLHGADVRALQGALNVLGFACGEPDGIFGAFTERAVGEFQINSGLPADGIAGPETVRALERLRHVWEGKDPSSPAALTVAAARAAELLRHASVRITCDGVAGETVGRRFVNLALAAEPDSNVVVAEPGEAPGADLCLRVTADPGGAFARGVPVVTFSAEAHAPVRFMSAFQAAGRRTEVVVVVPVSVVHSEHLAQASAVWILDGVCAVLAAGRPSPVIR